MNFADITLIYVKSWSIYIDFRVKYEKHYVPLFLDWEYFYFKYFVFHVTVRVMVR